MAELTQVWEDYAGSLNSGMHQLSLVQVFLASLSIALLYELCLSSLQRSKFVLFAYYLELNSKENHY